ncbi:TetR/AcrR family transcriptional regulator [Nocardia rhizosphaerihabitans]|uniref:TetR/AcrR family transcriptional regulator n=1 Tax=Nocardia rhizosphaerihabitans TaxID=1691570 RepID=UPI00367244EF
MSMVTTSPTGRPLRADAARNRLLILDAAREVFAEQGLDVTLADVAEHAGLGVGTVYRRFASKDELVDAVFERFFQDMADAAERALAAADPWDALTEFFEFAGAHMAVNKGLVDVMAGADQGCAQLTGQRPRVESAIGELFARAQSAGELRADAEPSDFFALIYMVGTMAEFAQPVNPDAWRRYLALILDGLRDPRFARPDLPAAALTPDEVDRARQHLQGRRRHIRRGD